MMDEFTKYKFYQWFIGACKLVTRMMRWPGFSQYYQWRVNRLYGRLVKLAKRFEFLYNADRMEECQEEIKKFRELCRKHRFWITPDEIQFKIPVMFFFKCEICTDLANNKGFADVIDYLQECDAPAKYARPIGIPLKSSVWIAFCVWLTKEYLGGRSILNEGELAILGFTSAFELDDKIRCFFNQHNISLDEHARHGIFFFDESRPKKQAQFKDFHSKLKLFSETIRESDDKDAGAKWILGYCVAVINAELKEVMVHGEKPH